jgi:hypothetical protein
MLELLHSGGGTHRATTTCCGSANLPDEHRVGDQAKATIQAPPFVAAWLPWFDFTPVGPLKSLGQLIQGK